MWAARWSVSLPSGTTVTSSTWIAKATTTSHSPRSSSSDSRLSLPPATGTVTSSRRKARARVIGGRGGSIQVFVTDGFDLAGAKRAWTDVCGPNVQRSAGGSDAAPFRPMDRQRCRPTPGAPPKKRGDTDALEDPPYVADPQGQELPHRGRRRRSTGYARGAWSAP